MKNIKSQRGQAIIMLAFAVVVLVGFAALAIDGGRALSDKRHAQNAADTSAFAAALAKIYGDDYEQAAILRAASNGYNNGPNGNGSTSIVEVDLCSELALLGTTCQGMSAGADPADYIRVKITSTIDTTFARVIGRPQVTVAVEAIAHASGVTSNPLVQGAALAAYDKSGTSFFGDGSGSLEVIGSGIFSNSTDTDCPNGAMKLWGNMEYKVDTAYTSAGANCAGNNVDIDTSLYKHVDPVDIPDFNVPAPSFTCGPPPDTEIVNNVIQPGTHNALTLSDDYSFVPNGNYCFNGNLKFTGGNITANNVNIRVNGDFTTSGNTTFTCSNVVFHAANGSGGITFNGGNNHCSEVTFYLSSGGIHWAGNVDNDFAAPTSGPYDGLLVYLPNSNKSAITINGNSASLYTGSIIAIGSNVTIDGKSDTDGFHTQILAATIKLTGAGKTRIIYNPEELFNPPKYPSIELTK